MVNLNTDQPDDEPTSEEIARHEIEQLLNDAAAQFDQLCMDRHDVGMKEYGALTFLENDVVRMMLEELADTANYCRMQGVKLMILQQQLEHTMGANGFVGEAGTIELGFEAFRGTKETGWRR